MQPLQWLYTECFVEIQSIELFKILILVGQIDYDIHSHNSNTNQLCILCIPFQLTT